MEKFDIRKYLEIALRRKYWVVIPFMVILLVGLAYTLNAPKIYEAETLILVQAQKVPQNFVRSIVSSDVDERLRTITQQVTSRTNLESIIQDYQLYNDPAQKDMLLEDKVDQLRKNIDIHVTAKGRDGGNAFSITFDGPDPKKVMEVANALASNFISENLKIRESQAIGTSNFLADELDVYKKRLDEKEEAISKFNQEHMGEMPEQLNTNLRMFGSSQQELEALYSRLNDAKNRKLLIQQQAKQSEDMASQLSGGSDLGDLLGSGDDSSGGGDESLALEQLRERLKSLKLKYTDNYPDVKAVQAQITKLEAQQKEEAEKNSETEATGDKNKETSSTDELSLSNTDFTKVQVDQVDAEIKELNKEIAEAKKKVAFYKKRVEDTPKREQEILSISRDYNNLKEVYDKMLDRKLEAELSVSMERKQKGEQFRVIDPAQIPLRPVKPDAKRIMAIVIVLGLGIGCGSAYLVELLDTSYRSPDEAEKDLGVPVLISLPYLYTEQEIYTRRKKRIIIASSMIISYGIALFAVVVFTKGFRETIEFIKEIFTNTGVA